MVPASSRPYVGSSTNNSVIELIVGHNGLERLGLSSSSAGGGNSVMKANEGSASGTAATTPSGAPEGTTGSGYGGPDSGGTPPSGTSQSGYGPSGGGTPPTGVNMPSKMAGGAGGNSTFGGSEPSSIARLFSNNSLSDQIIWMFPLALFGLLVAALKEKQRFRVDTKEKQELLLWGAWLVPVFAYFSFTTGLFHPYYLTMLAPPIAALSGIGVVSMWQLYKEEKGWKGWLLPAALAVTGAVQLLILSYNMNSYAFVKYIMIAAGVLCLGSSLGLSVLKAVQKGAGHKLKKSLAALALAGLLTAPVIWSGTTIFYKMSGTFPAAGLSLMSGSGMGMGGSGGIVSGDTTTTSKLVDYLKANRTTENYLVAVPSSMSYATDIIINYGEPVMTLGGFSGSDSILTLDEFKQMVKNGEIRYAIAGGGGGQGGNSEITSWIQANGKAVTESEWNSTSSTNSTSKGQSVQLYDLKGIL
jgi:4-amino-4-deoxy-L-arabinose transferase-like glycosyltransferase